MLVEQEVKSFAIVVMTSVTVITGQQNLSQLSYSHSVCFSLPEFYSDFQNLHHGALCGK